MGNWKRYLLIGATAYLLFLIINIPATLLLPHVNQLLPNSPVRMEGAQGTIWSGSAEVLIKPSRKVALSGRLTFSWSFSFIDLLFGQLGIDYSLSGADLAAEGHLAAGLGPIHLAIESGAVGPSWINPLLNSQGASIAQAVSISELFLDFDFSEKLADEAGGILAWPGGSVAVTKPQSGSLTFPPVKGLLSTTERQTLMLDIQEQATNKQLVTAELLQSGFARLRILKRVQPLIGMGQSGNPDDTLLELKQKIL